MTIKRYHGQPLPITVEFDSNPLAPYGKVYADIEDVSMNLKRNLLTDADDAYLEKKQSTNGVTIDTENHEFTMAVGVNDYTNLTVHNAYYLTLNVKVSGVADYIELPVSNRKILITPDTNRA